VADPEILDRGDELGTLRGRGLRRGLCLLPRKFLNFKSENGAFFVHF